MKLYYSPGSCALASHITLAEAEANFEAIRIDFGNNEQRSAEYLATNPKGRVPALVTDRGTLTETPAILAFIAQSYPQAALAPLDDPFAFASMQAFNSYLCSTAHVAHAHGSRSHRWADLPASHADMKQKVKETMSACFEFIENSYLTGPWVMGEQYTVCDPYLYTITHWLAGDGVDVERFPKVAQHHQRIAERPRVKQVLIEHFA